MPTRYVDSNRGNDSNDGLTKQTAYRSLSKLNGINFNAGSQILLANDSFFEINPTLTASNRIALDSCIGAAGNRNIITGYDYSGVTGTKPVIRYRFLPQSVDWTWDASNQAWYVQFTQGAIDFDMMVAIGGVMIPSTFQGNGGLGISNFINGVNANTLRSFVDTAARRVYLAYQGIRSTVTPNQHFQQEIVFGCSSAIVTSFLMPYTTIDGIECYGGGRLLTIGGSDSGLIADEFELKNCTVENCTGLVSCNTNGIGASGRFGIDIHHNWLVNSYGSGIKCAGQSYAGYVRDNYHSRGGLGDCTGGGEYIQCTVASGYTFELNDAVMDRMTNGAGTCTFDGCGIYLELGSNNVVVNRAKVTNSFKAFQLNSGRKSTLLSCVALNCDMFGTFTDADNVGTSDYLIANCTHVSTPDLVSFPRGNQTTFNNAIGAYDTGAGITSAKLVNNLFIGYGRAAKNDGILWYNSIHWNASKCTVLNNVFSGWGTRLVEDQDYRDRSAGNFNFTVEVDTEGRPITSAVYGIGTKNDAAYRDFTGLLYNNPPAVGAFERNIYSSFKGVQL